MPQRVEGSVVVEAPVARVYEYWSNLENLPNFMSNIEEVRAMGPDRTQWRVKGPLGAKMEFDALTTRQEENRAIAWNTVGGNIQTSGEVSFQELGPERTSVEVTMNYSDPPGGKLGEVGSRFVASPQAMMDQDLQYFKEIMEGLATPEEIQQRASVASVQSHVFAFLSSGTSLLILGGALLLLLILRRRRPRRRARSAKRGRIIFEF
jgi:uncharacterized membrane protein